MGARVLRVIWANYAFLLKTEEVSIQCSHIFKVQLMLYYGGRYESGEIGP